VIQVSHFRVPQLFAECLSKQIHVLETEFQTFLPYTKPCIARLCDDEAAPLDAKDVAALLEEEEAAKEMAVLPVKVEAACWT
jgi:hypothetical protein